VKFSIIVPTYNEQNDIGGTLDALVALDYPDKEIIIADDSTDATPDIVRLYADRGVRLIHPAGGGRCEARNIGIMEATGEIVCILNADVRLPRDFLGRVAVHYRDGYDYVLVETMVSNQEFLFARFMGAAWAADYNPKNVSAGRKMDWTEGYTCRKSVAVAAGLFPTGYIVPIVAGEDGEFGEGVRRVGAKGKVAWDIVIEQVAPAAFGEYWRARKERGVGSAQCHRLINGWSYTKLYTWNLLKLVRTVAYIVLVVPMLTLNWGYAKYSPRGRRDTLAFIWAWLVQQAAFHTGEWQTTLQIRRIEKAKKPA
jgi:glycosyltransferase involved in cell wall biosynthesis